MPGVTPFNSEPMEKGRDLNVGDEAFSPMSDNSMNISRVQANKREE